MDVSDGIMVTGRPAKGRSSGTFMLLDQRRQEILSLVESEGFVSLQQLTDRAGVSESTVRRLAARRRIPSVRLTPRIIRFHLDAVREALDVPRYRIRHGEYTEPVDDAQLSFDEFFLS